MADVYKFRVTVDLELSTHSTPKEVRDFLKTEVQSWLEARRMDSSFGYIVESVMEFNVRTKRLDDWFDLRPAVQLRIPAITCPHCKRQYTDVVVTALPLKCGICNREMPLEGTVTP